PLANNYSLNTVDICPVGALTSNDFRFKMRVWFMRETESVCNGCARGCNILISSRENKIYRQTPRENNEVNSSWMCDSGRLNYHLLESSARLTDPMIKRGKSHETVDWPQAIRRVAEGLLKYEGHEIAIIASARMTNEELYLIRVLSESIGTKNVDVVKCHGEGDDYLSHEDKRPNTNGAKVILRLRSPGSRINTIRKGIESGSIKALLVYGENIVREGFDDELLSKLKFLASSHILANPTAKVSNIVLPGAGYAEKRGSMINATGRLQLLNKAIEPPGNSKDDWEVLEDLNRAMDGKDSVHDLADIFSEMASDVPAFKGLSLSAIGGKGVPVIETGEAVPLLEREAQRVREGLIVG
ncbi:MAG: molybdopterin-dependent oxidoreductase, partial [Verrucomicrobiota bacterium]|nr:molybdopterin-dependent oxidoreductase [Verrucomicrobiota bacterium]